MKPYIQIVRIGGKVGYMHDSADNLRCDCTVYGDVPGDFHVTVSGTVTDRKFDFRNRVVAEIIAKTVSENTVEFIEAMFERELCEVIEENELFYGYDGFDQSLITDFLDGKYRVEHGYFYRLTEQPNGEWILSFVFSDGSEAKSEPVAWPDFASGEPA